MTGNPVEVLERTCRSLPFIRDLLRSLGWLEMSPSEPLTAKRTH